MMALWTDTARTAIFVLLDFLWQSSVLIALALGGMKVFRVRSVSVRHSLLVCVLLGVGVLPLVNIMWRGAGLSRLSVRLVSEKGGQAIQTLRDSVPPSEGDHPARDREEAVRMSSPAPEGVGSTGTTSSIAARAGKSRQAWFRMMTRWVSLYGYELLFILWVSGVLVGLSRVFWGYRTLRRIKASCHPVEDTSVLAAYEEALAVMGLRRRPELLASRQTPTPIAVGLFRPMILVPDTLGDMLSSEKLRMVFLHELLHIQRHDLLVGLYQRLLTVVWFFHPLLRYLNIRIGRVREDRCDGLVVAKTGAKAAYASALTELFECVNGSESSLLVAAGLHYRSELAGRVRGILDGIPVGSLSRRGVAGTVVLTGFVVGLLSSVTVLRGAEVLRQEQGWTREQAERRFREALLHPDEASRSLIYRSGGGRIAVVVEDVQGESVSDAQVQIVGVTLPNGLFVYLKEGPELRVGDDGVHTLDGLRKGKYLLRFWSDELRCRGRADGVSPGRRPVRVTLGLMGSISGQVMDEEGRPIQGAEISAMIGRYDPPPGGPYADEHRSVTDAEGRYLLASIPYRFGESDEVPWTYAIPAQKVWTIVRAKGYITTREGVRLEYGERKEGVDVELVSGGVSVSGVVHDTAGMAVAGAWVDVTGTGSWGKGVSADGGRFVIDGLRPGTFAVSADAGGFAPTVVPGVSGGTDDLEIILDRGGAISGRVMEAVPDAYSSRPLKGVVVQAWHQIDSWLHRHSSTDENGLYRIPALAAGPYRVRVASSQSPSIRGRLVAFDEKNIEVKEGQVRAGVDFYLQPGISVSGRLTYRDTGERAGTVKVTLQGRNRMDTVTDEEGRYRFDGVAPGEYWFQTDLGGYVEVPYHRRVLVERDPEAEDIEGVDIQLVQRASLRIRVTDAEGRPVPGAEVRYVGSNQRTDEDGECRYEEIRPESPYPLMVDHPEYAFAFLDSLILTPGEDRRMTCVLSSGGTLEGTVTDWEGEPVPNARVK